MCPMYHNNPILLPSNFEYIWLHNNIYVSVQNPTQTYIKHIFRLVWYLSNNHSTIQYYIFPRLNNYGSIHVIHKHHTYLHEIQISTKTEIPKQNSLLISQYFNLHIWKHTWLANHPLSRFLSPAFNNHYHCHHCL